MNYLKKWADKHVLRILGELKEQGIELSVENIPEIISATSFAERSVRYPDACPCNSSGPCHPEVRDLNCFLCPCPEYENEKLEGGCKINCSEGKWYRGLNGQIWDCSDCVVPHSFLYVENYLNRKMKKLKRISEGL